MKCTMLQSTHAFHSKYMDPMLEEYRKVAEGIQYGKGSSDCIYVSGMLGTALEADSVDADYWVRHTRDQVNFLSACKLVTEGLNCSTFLELGPHPVLSALLTQNCQSVENPILCLPSLRRNAEDWKSILSSVGKLFVERGVDIDWAGFDRGYKRQRIANLLPTYPFQRTTFWPKVDSNPLLHNSKHILLGSRITNPTDTAIFQSKVSPEKELKYLKDHLLENRILFPGAGYFEMMLAAGSTYFFGDLDHHFQHPTRPIQLTKLRIYSPLQVDENGSSSGVFCQTTLKTTREEIGDEQGGFSSAVYHLEEEDGNVKGPSSLKQHASASFYPNNSTGNSNDEHLKDLLKFYNQDNNMQIISSIKSHYEEDYPFKALYEQQNKTGLHLGESFRALRKIWKDSEGQQVLVEAAVPANSKSYLLHPILIDAMVQVACQSKIDYEKQQQKKKIKQGQGLMVLVGCQRFIWMQSLRTKNCFIYCPDSRFQSVLLFDENGGLIAIMYNVELAETDLEAVKGALDHRHKIQLKMFCHEWKKTSTLPLSNFPNITNSIPDLVEFARRAGQLNSEMTKGERQKKQDINKLVSLYTLRTFYILGWMPKTGAEFTIKQVIKNLNILDKQEKLFKHLFEYLVEDGLLTMKEVKGKKYYATSGVLNSLNEVEQAIKSRENNQITQDFELIKSVGEKLDKLFTGKESVLPVLCPNEAATYNYFEEQVSKINPFCKDILKQRWDALKEAYNKTGGPVPTLRILEIGANNGSASGTYLESLVKAGIPFIFVFTDPSPGVFPAVKKKFEKFEKMMKFKALDVEEEPIDQGFPPNYFDIVIASQTLHQLKDVERSLCNIRKMLVDDGNLWLSETIKENDRVTNLCYGLLNEFWRFTDLHLRPDHCLLSAEKWKHVLKKTGFSDVHINQYGKDEIYGLIACKADKNQEVEKVLSLPQQTLLANQSICMDYECPKWLIFYQKAEKIVADHLVNYFNYVGIKQVKLVELSEVSDTISKITEQVPTLEGIIVTWGLISSEEERDQEKLAKPYLKLLQTIVMLPSGKKVPQCILLSKGQYPVEDVVCPNPSPSTLIGMSLTALNEYQELNLRVMDLEPEVDFSSALWQAFQEIFNRLDEKDPALVSVFRGGSKFSPKLSMGSPPSASLALPRSSDRYQLELPQSKLIQDLKFRPLESCHLHENEIEVKTICSALNFRDLLSILKPTKFFENINQVGCDFAGEVISIGSSVTEVTVGDKVFGVVPSNRALPSHIKIKADFVQKVPSSFTLAEAACMPIVFSTAYYSLIEVAHAKSGETILIHTASGGVGLVAIQIAKHLGLQIICTAGNERKRSYLRSLGILHVFNSRTLEFSKQILEVTNGKGVDIVLNSITGQGFKEASLEATAKKGGRFLEMSKLNIWTAKDVAELRPDVAYSIIDISQEGEEFALTVLKPLMIQLKNWMWNGKLKPIPYTRYDIGDIRDALGYLQKAKHIGKIICAAPTRDLSAVDTQKVSLFNEKSAYLITGGLGGIGLEVCKWMLNQGAGHIVLVGRNPPTSRVSNTLESLRKLFSGRWIHVLQGDVGSWESCKGIFQKMSSMNELPPLRGVMHAAGTLADAILQNVTWEDFQQIFQSKVDGSWNLHELTKQLPLEHFVLFSSLSSMIGTPGQAPYVAGNFFQDTLAHFRKSHGLPATTINWGQWGSVGLAKDMKFRLVLPLTPKQCIGALDLVMRKNMSAVTVASFRDNLDSQIEFHSYIKWIVDPKIVRQTANTTTKVSLSNSQVNSAKFLDEYETCGKSLDDKTSVVRSYLKILLRIVLHMNPEEDINEDDDLSILGMDSLMMIELFNLMQGLCGKKITLSQSAIRECKTLRDLVTCFMKLLEEKWEEVPIPSTHDVMKQSLLDVILPPDIKAEVEGSHVAASQIKRLLLTGATGFLGSHILKELLETCPKLERIYCLVRGKNPKSRLLSVLEKHHISVPESIFQNRVSVISGDFALPMLGLSEKEYLGLSQEIEAILNAGAMVHHYEYYKAIPNSSNDIRSVNVGGLLNLLRFACKTQTKHVFHVSSLLTVFEIGEDDRLLESWPSVQSLANMGHIMGYPVSKMINELHIKEAVEKRGIPAKVLRLANLRSSTFYGKSFTNGDHFLKLMLFCLKEGIVPELPGLANFLPVDVAAKLIIGIIFQDNVPSEGFNISRRQPPALFQGVFEKIGEELGFPVKKEVINLEEFRTLVVQRCREAKKEFEQTGDTAELRKAILYEFQLFYESKDLFQYAMHMIHHGDSFDERQLGEDYWTSKKLMRYIPNLYCQMEDVEQVLKRDLRVAMKEEFPDLFGNV